MEIIICTHCKGKGEVTVEKGNGYHWDYCKEECSECKGTGRIITMTFKLTVPFGHPDSDLSKIETKIIRLIREFEKGN